MKLFYVYFITLLKCYIYIGKDFELNLTTNAAPNSNAAISRIYIMFRVNILIINQKQMTLMTADEVLRYDLCISVGVKMKFLWYI